MAKVEMSPVKVAVEGSRTRWARPKVRGGGQEKASFQPTSGTQSCGMGRSLGSKISLYPGPCPPGSVWEDSLAACLHLAEAVTDTAVADGGVVRGTELPVLKGEVGGGSCEHPSL